MATYQSSYTGVQIDTAVGKALTPDTTLSVTGSLADAKAAGDAISAADEKIGKWVEMDGVTVDGNLLPTATEQGDGGYYASEGTIYPITYEGYKYFKIPVKSNTTYSLYGEARWWFSTDANGDVVSSIPIQTSANQMNTGANAVELCITYNSSTYPNIAIVEGFINPTDTNTSYVLPDNVLQKNITSDDIVGFKWGNLKNKFIVDKLGYYRYTDVTGVAPIAYLNAEYNSYVLEIENANYMIYPRARFLTPVDSNGIAVAVSTAFATSYDNTAGTAKYLYITTKAEEDDELVVSKGSDLTIDNEYPSWLEQLKYIPKSPTKYFEKYIGNYTEQINLNEIASCVSSNVEYSFGADISDWDVDSSISFVLKATTGAIEAEKFTIDNTNLTITDYYYGNPQTVTYAHGLTIANNIQLHIKFTYGEMFAIEITSNGITYSKEKVTAKQFITYPSILCTNTAPTNCSFSWVSRDIDNPIWCFGDSYYGATSDNRWVYYLVQNGYYEGHLFDNYPGCNSIAAFSSLENLISVSKPKTIFWCLGMNDGSDTESAYSSTWKTYLDKVIALCQVNGIELILATIPTVPNISHEKKNEWIRNSGYQYVDFAKAVGADANGEWYSGMLSSDDVHPSTTGAKALYYRVLSDFPQITIH